MDTGETPQVRDEVDEATMHPESMLIVRLMQLLQRNEDVRQIEAALKHDAVLTCRVLRYINSPTIGPGVEDPVAAACGHHAGLLAPVPLAGPAAGRQQQGLEFALHDAQGHHARPGGGAHGQGRCLRPPTATTSSWWACSRSSTSCWACPWSRCWPKVQLAESVQQAILHRHGVYGPFLALAKAPSRTQRRPRGWPRRPVRGPRAGQWRGAVGPGVVAGSGGRRVPVLMKVREGGHLTA